uniref:Sphingomyelin synthase-like domain-containing protein n=1 Tax=Pelusios castaneus TaxID=367368 RepID=A0A8C8VMG1_9SAUR
TQYCPFPHPTGQKLYLLGFFPMDHHQDSTIPIDSCVPLPSPDLPISACWSPDAKSSESESQRRHKSVHIRVIDVGIRYPAEWHKTFAMLLYAGCSLLLSSSVIVFVNSWSSAKHVLSPFPDLIPTYIGHADWIFKASEVSSLVLLILWSIQWFLLRYKSIVGRRFLFIIGTLHLYRTLTIYGTVLPVPSSDMTCEEKLNGDWKLLLKQTLKLVSTGGFFQRSPTLCGDYVPTGQTAGLILTYMFIKAYSPGKFWVYHLLCWFLCVMGAASVMFTHITLLLDVIAAYFITTRMFWWYHTLANNQCLKIPSPHNYLSRIWWFRIFVFCEENVMGTIPLSYSWPVSCSICQD